MCGGAARAFPLPPVKPVIRPQGRAARKDTRYFMSVNYSVIFTQRQKAELIASPFCEKPGPDEIVGKTVVSVISNGSETGGFMGYGGSEGLYPCETGYANILKVTETGSRVEGISPGDLVFSLTPHKLYNRASARDVFLVPGDIPPEKAALCRFPAVSMTAFLYSDIRPTEAVLVSGLGIVGLMCAQVMQRCGFAVYASDPDQKRQETARSCGLKHVGPSVESFGLPEKSAGLGIDCSGNDQAILSLIPYIRQLGQLALVGVPWRQTSDLSAHELLRQIFYSYLRVYSGWEWSLPRRSGDFDPNSNLRSMQKALEWIADGSIVTDGIYRLFSPKDCSALYPAIAARELDKPCAIFDWRPFHEGISPAAGSEGEVAEG